MTSTTFKDQEGNGASASEAILPEGMEGLAAIMNMVANRSIAPNGGLDVDSSSLDMLREQGSREALLRDFVIAMMPDRVNPVIWTRWLQGGASPFERAKLTQVDPAGQSISRALDRQSKRVGRGKASVANARRAVDAAQKKLADAEHELAQAQALDAGLIEYVVSEHLLGIMAPMFAMGPAWTIMRAVSAHIDAAALADELSLIRDPKRRAEREEQIRIERRESSEKMLDVLDLWAGDVDFEYELREALEAVTSKYAGRDRPDVVRRSRASMKKGLSDPELMRDRDEILAGMKRPSK